LALDALTNEVEGALRMLANEGVDVESGDRAIGVGNDRDDLGAGRDVVQRLNYESSLIAHFQWV
jgi:hypothetical protein